MKLVTVAGPPSCGKTSVLVRAIALLEARGLRCGVAKFDCLSNQDEATYAAHGITAIAGLSGGQCPDHYFATNIESVVEWGHKQDFDILITESAGLCNRCSPYLESGLSVCVLDNLAGMGAPAKIGPLLRCADIVVVTKSDLVSPAEREVFTLRVSQLTPRATVIFVNGITGQGALLLANRIARSADIGDVSQCELRYAMPSAVCSFCIGERRVGRSFQTGNLVPLFEDDGLPPFALPAFSPAERSANAAKGGAK